MEDGSNWSRSVEADALRDAILEVRGPRIITLKGARGSGKSHLIRELLAGPGFESEGKTRWDLLHLEAAPLTAADHLFDFEELVRRALGEVPAPRRPGAIPLGSREGSWPALLSGLAGHLEDRGRRMLLVLDGVGELHGARRRLPGELAEFMERIRGRELPLILLLTARSNAELRPFTGAHGAMGSADFELALAPISYRTAGWAHGGRDPGDAFLRWAILGDDPSHLPAHPPEESLEDAVVRRVLLPDGDLYDAPLRRLETAFQRPGRYASILRALAGGALEWPELLEAARGVEAGGQLAPYLKRLEEEGLIQVVAPLAARPGSRGKRYALAEPFLSFWLGWVLPRRSILHPRRAREIWRSEIFPQLSTHFQQWMEEAARRWFRDHVAEVFGVEAREAGAIWGEGTEIPVAGLLTNGAVGFGLVQWEGVEEDLAAKLARRMHGTRYGIGRESRIPIFFLAREGDEGFRRKLVRDPLARMVTLAQLMGPNELV